MREVEIQDERKGFRSKSRIIVSTFLDPSFMSKNDFKTIYDNRWSIEVFLIY
jgi:hypothetical protein